MVRRLLDRLKFYLERLIQRGALQQLIFVAALIVLIAVSGGIAAWALTDAFASLDEAIWWSFLRLTDPGYLGDDDGIALRVISTIVTVLGYVLFMGSLIAIMTQWLNRFIRTLESGLTPISMKDHFLVLGWTNRTPSIVRELVLSEGRVRRFLKLRGSGRIRIVILAEEVNAELRQELRDLLGRALKRSQIILRSGSSMRIEHLRRVDYAHAAAIIIPGADYELGGPEGMDSRVIKTLMSISKYGQLDDDDHYPVVVAEIFDAHKAPIAEQAYRGLIHILSGDAFISRLIAQNVRHRGLSHVYAELLSHTHGNEIYVRSWPELAGVTFGRLVDAFPQAVLLGVVQPAGTRFRPTLNPSPGYTLTNEDRLVILARGYEEAAPDIAAIREEQPPEPISRQKAETMASRRILILGWSHKIAALVHEFGSYPSERFEIDIMSVIPLDKRESAMRRFSVSPEWVQIRQIEGDYTNQPDLEQIDPASYDNVVFPGSDWLDSSEESDARTILGYVLLRALLGPDATQPEILVELKDPSNERLFRQRAGEVIISPLILSHMLAHASLRQELTSVFSELFGPGGAEIFFRSVDDYGLLDRDANFREIQQQAAVRGEIALGVWLQTPSSNPVGGVYLNPPRRTKWRLGDDDEIVVLTRYS